MVEYDGCCFSPVFECCSGKTMVESQGAPAGCMGCGVTYELGIVEPMVHETTHDKASEILAPERTHDSPPTPADVTPHLAPTPEPAPAVSPKLKSEEAEAPASAVEKPPTIDGEDADALAPALPNEPPTIELSDENTGEPAAAAASIFGDPDLSADPDSDSPPLSADSQDFPAVEEGDVQNNLKAEPDASKESLPSPDALESFDFGDPPTEAPSATPEATPPAEDSGDDVLDGLGAGMAPAAKGEFISVRERGVARRYWSDESGSFHTTGQLVSISVESVRILKDNGRYSTVPVHRLSRVDRAYVRALETELARPSAIASKATPSKAIASK